MLVEGNCAHLSENIKFQMVVEILQFLRVRKIKGAKKFWHSQPSCHVFSDTYYLHDQILCVPLKFSFILWSNWEILSKIYTVRATTKNGWYLSHGKSRWRATSVWYISKQGVFSITYLCPTLMDLNEWTVAHLTLWRHTPGLYLVK